MSTNNHIIGQIYDNTLRKFLPRKLGVSNGVIVRKPKLFDITDVDENHETAICDALESHCRTDDDVVVIGGGWGVTAVIASRKAATVKVFEAGQRQLKILQEVIELNNADNISIIHGVVGEAVDIYGPVGNADIIAPEDIPVCDILEMDCEGAELKILRMLETRPRVIIVETHPHLGSPTRDVEVQLNKLGYSILSKETENAENEVMVLVAEYNGK